tara:strand:+ start:701 stop:937 length:237 start_codon:yes stop_codon:yes gene_type:complete
MMSNDWSVTKEKLENRVLELEMENAELRDKLVDLGYEEWIKENKNWLDKLTFETPNNMELGKKVRRKVWSWHDEQEGC